MGVEPVEATVAGGAASVGGAELVRDRVDRWDEPRELSVDERAGFLEYVTANPVCSIKEAASAAGVRRRDVKKLLREDGEFQEDYRMARGYATEQIYGAMVKLAIEGVEEPVVSAGKLVRDDDGKVVTVRKYSDRLLSAMFNGLTEEGKAMLGQRLEITGADGGPVKVQGGVALTDVLAFMQKHVHQAQLEAPPAGELVAETDEPVE